jgi:hypothetical protein
VAIHHLHGHAWHIGQAATRLPAWLPGSGRCCCCCSMQRCRAAHGMPHNQHEGLACYVLPNSRRPAGKGGSISSPAIGLCRTACHGCHDALNQRWSAVLATPYTRTYLTSTTYTPFCRRHVPATSWHSCVVAVQAQALLPCMYQPVWWGLSWQLGHLDMGAPLPGTSGPMYCAWHRHPSLTAIQSHCTPRLGPVWHWQVPGC